jgi:signal transduction histidine kinase
VSNPVEPHAPPLPADTGVASPDATDGDPAARIAVLERRWHREREARLESERIAEAGLRRLWEATQQLDQRVEERTEELRAARAEAEAAAEAKTEFLANLSHEVRTPLQTILSALELAEPAGAADGVRLDEATTATRELRVLFDNLLELAQCEVGSIEFRPADTDLEDLADELADRWRARLTARGLLLVPESEGSALVDRTRLVQIGDALLDNAVKFAAPGTVQVRLGRRGGVVELVVADDGPGMDPGALERIFEPFVQVHGGNDRRVGGAGIGLALVRGLAQQMGGRARADLSPGGGLAVTVRIPDPPLHPHPRRSP